MVKKRNWRRSNNTPYATEQGINSAEQEILAQEQGNSPAKIKIVAGWGFRYTQGTNLYAVCAGAVRVSAPSDQGKDAVFNLIVPGEIFGEIAFLDGGPRTADAVMIESGELMVIERRDFLPLPHDYPELALRLLEILCRRLRHTSEQVEDIVFLGLKARLAKMLLYLYEHSSFGHRKN